MHRSSYHKFSHSTRATARINLRTSTVFFASFDCLTNFWPAYILSMLPVLGRTIHTTWSAPVSPLITGSAHKSLANTHPMCVTCSGSWWQASTCVRRQMPVWRTRAGPRARRAARERLERVHQPSRASESTLRLQAYRSASPSACTATADASVPA